VRSSWRDGCGVDAVRVCVLWRLQRYIFLEVVDDPDNVYRMTRGDPGHVYQLDLVRKEAELFGTLHHPNVLKLLGVVRDAHGDITALVMELASGTLKSLCEQLGMCTRKKPDTGAGMSPDTLRVIMLGAARGLAYLHAQAPPVYHRDLKDDNLFVFVDEVTGAVVTAKLGDFGEAKVGLAARASGVWQLWCASAGTCLHA
jgi:serine/threonine protein kinase